MKVLDTLVDHNAEKARGYLGGTVLCQFWPWASLTRRAAPLLAFPGLHECALNCSWILAASLEWTQKLLLEPIEM